MGKVSAKAVAPLLALAAFSLSGAPAQEQAAPGIVVNDVHSRLNETRVQRVETPDSVEAIQAIVRQARNERRAISIAGGRHAMGAQQFGTDTEMISEVFVRRAALAVFMKDVATDFRDDERFLPWAKERYASVISTCTPPTTRRRWRRRRGVPPPHRSGDPARRATS